jgi:quercetin dioxygenase-like cupin family protein
MYFYDFNAIEYKKKRARVSLKSMTGEVSQLCIMKLMPGEKTDHRHPQEQIGYILSGQVEIFVDQDKKVLGPGEGYCIPGNVRHGFSVAGQPVVYIEIFSPSKEENNL